MQNPKTLEEAAAALIATVDDGVLSRAVAGDFGNEVRLLSLGENVRREQRKAGTRRSAA